MLSNAEIEPVDIKMRVALIRVYSGVIVASLKILLEVEHVYYV